MEGGGGDVLRGEHVAFGAGFGEFLFAALEIVVEEWGVDVSGRDGRDADGGFGEGEFAAKGFGDGADCEFGGGVESAGGRNAMAGERGDIQNVAAMFREKFEGVLGAEGKGVDVDLPHFFPLGRVAGGDGR